MIANKFWPLSLLVSIDVVVSIDGIVSIDVVVYFDVVASLLHGRTHYKEVSLCVPCPSPPFMSARGA